MIDELITLGKKNDLDIEVNEEVNNITEISTLNDTLKLFEIKNITTYKIKAIRNDRFATIMTDDLKHPEIIIKNLENSILLEDNINKNKLCTNNLIDNKNELENIEPSVIKEDLLSLNDLKENYRYITDIECSYMNIYAKETIKNSNCTLEQNSSYNEYGFSISMVKDGIKKVKYVYFNQKNYDFEEVKKNIISNIEILEKRLDSDSIDTNKYNVLINNNVVANILESFYQSFHSKSIYLKESILTDKLNSKIFSDKINIIEDSKNGLCTIGFDSEGTIKEYQQIVKDGVFVKEVNNIEYALKLGNKPTGNANGAHNFYIKPGNNSYEEMIEKLNDGIIIDDAYGLHSGIDLQSGTISLHADGLLVKNGKIVKGLNMIILATNFFEMFKNVVMVGNDLSKSNVDFLAPSLLLENITIAGKKEENE